MHATAGGQPTDPRVKWTFLVMSQPAYGESERKLDQWMSEARPYSCEGGEPYRPRSQTNNVCKLEPVAPLAWMGTTLVLVYLVETRVTNTNVRSGI